MSKFGPFSVESFAPKPNDPKTFPPFVRIHVYEQESAQQLMTEKEIGERIQLLRTQLDQLEQAAKAELNGVLKKG